MFTGKISVGWQNVKCVIIDEVHDLAASERGWQLTIGLSRLEHLSGNKYKELASLQLVIQFKLRNGCLQMIVFQ